MTHIFGFTLFEVCPTQTGNSGLEQLSNRTFGPFMPTVIIDGVSLEVEPGTSILQACEQLGIEVPRFCFHDKLSVAGNCRMCLVQVKGAPKPVASCTMACTDKMEVLTGSEMVHKSRKGVMEMMLANHPLDCPICDQGGECDLQDQSVAYGFDRGRFAENKRAVPDKELGPLIRTVMTRCINCTRCVRFSEEVAGNSELGQMGRGEHAEIGPYIDAAITSELSGNMIDVCPVGALTSKPYTFRARPWEMRKTESVDVMDAMGANIRVDSRGGEVMRILPRLNEEINEEWISDRTRFAYDGLKRGRLDTPYIRVHGKLTPATGEDAFRHIQEKMMGLRGDAVAAISGDLVAAEELIALRRLMETLGSQNMEPRQRGETLDGTQPAGWMFNSTIAGIDQADLILLVGTNPRHEAAVLNARILKRVNTGACDVCNIGAANDLTYATTQLGDSLAILQAIADGRHEFAEKLKAAKNPMLILGMGALSRKDGAAVHAAASRISAAYLQRGAWNGFNVLHAQIGLPTALATGFIPGTIGRDLAKIYQGVQDGSVKAVYLLGADEVATEKLKGAFVIYQGHHGDRAANVADVILPGAAYTEKNATYVNTEGRAQHGRQAVFPPGQAKEDWKIIRALSDYVGTPLRYITIADVRDDLASVFPAFSAIGKIVAADAAEFGTSGPIEAAAPTPVHANFYQTNAIARASETMAKCVAELLTAAQKKAA